MKSYPVFSLLHAFSSEDWGLSLGAVVAAVTPALNSTSSGCTALVSPRVWHRRNIWEALKHYQEDSWHGVQETALVGSSTAHLTTASRWAPQGRFSAQPLLCLGICCPPHLQPGHLQQWLRAGGAHTSQEYRRQKNVLTPRATSKEDGGDALEMFKYILIISL